MTACHALAQSQFQFKKKNQLINVLFCVIRTRVHLLFFFLSQHVRDEKINQKIIKEINPFLACWYIGE